MTSRKRCIREICSGETDKGYGVDPSKINVDLGRYPDTPFEVGIVKTIDWYLANEEWMNRVTSGDYQKYYETMYKGRQ